VIRVLVVEDEPVAAAAHSAYVERVPGFTTAGVVHTGRAALRFLESTPVDLVLLDLHLPDMHGLDVCHAMRVAGLRTDVMAVTSARDLAAVRSAVTLGVVHYVLKPFTFRTLHDKLTRYERFAASLRSEGMLAGQSDVDSAFAELRGVDAAALPPGLAEETLVLVVRALQGADGGLSAREVGDGCGLSRVTARRYLEYLAETGVAARAPRYGGAGRPEVEYAWRGPRPAR
jgi:response regulator of citrate/malate metabolism